MSRLTKFVYLWNRIITIIVVVIIGLLLQNGVSLLGLYLKTINTEYFICLLDIFIFGKIYNWIVNFWN